MIQFLLKAQPNSVNRTIAVKTWYKFESGPKMIDITGQERFTTSIEGLVDDDIKKVHAKEYAKFEQYLEGHAEELYNQCRADTDLVINVSALIKAEKAAAMVSASQEA